MALLKSAGDLLALGHDCVLRGDFSNANEKYTEAARKFAKQGDMMGAGVASSMAAVIAIGNQMSYPLAYRIASQSLNSLGNFTVKVGLRDVSAPQLAAELVLLGDEIELLANYPMNPLGHKEKAQALQALAMRFKTQLGGQVLVIPELFTKVVTTGDSKAIPLMAMAEEEFGKCFILYDPKAAAEHYQSARLWWMQAGRQDMADAASINVRLYGRSARCWFCGREVSGEGIHFLSMPSDLTELLKKTGEGSALPAFDPASKSIYACKGCHGAVFRLADDIALRRTQELEQRIAVQLNEIRAKIRNFGPRGT